MREAIDIAGVFGKNRKNKEKISLREMKNEISWMLSYTKKYLGTVIMGLVLTVTATGSGLLSGLASKYIIDAITGEGVLTFLQAMLLLAGASLAAIGIKAISSRISAAMTVKVKNGIQAEVYDSFLSTDWESVSSYRSGDLINRLSSDVAAVSGSIISFIPGFIGALFQFVGALAIILYFEPTMAVVSLLGIPFTLVASKIVIYGMRKHNRLMKEADSEIMAFHADSLQNLQSIKAFDAGRIFGGRMRKLQQSYKTVYMDYNRFSVFTSSFMSIVGLIVSAGCFGWGAYLLKKGAINFGTLTMFLQLSGTVSSSFTALASMLPTLVSTATSAGRIMNVTSLPREKRPERTLDNVGGSLSVVLENVTFAYRDDKTVVLENVNIEAHPGEIIAIVGPTGEGKTTLVRLLLGLLEPSDGTVKLVTGDGGEYEIAADTRRYFSYVPQGNTIFAGSIRENMSLASEDADDDEIRTVLELACADKFVDKLRDGIDFEVGEHGKGLSEGQSQRLAIARALLLNAPIMLLDEATSALDIATERRVLANIMKRSENCTCIVVTHRPSVLSMCDRVYNVETTHITQLTEAEIAERMADF